MKNLKFSMLLTLIVALGLTSCNDDDNNVVIQDQGQETPTIAELFLNSIAEDGGIPYDVNNPALTFTDEQNVFLPSILGIDFRVDRNVVPAGPTARFPLFQGWETLPDDTRREGYYVITEASDRELAEQLGIIYAPRMAASIGSGGE